MILLNQSVALFFFFQIRAKYGNVIHLHKTVPGVQPKHNPHLETD